MSDYQYIINYLNVPILIQRSQFLLLVLKSTILIRQLSSFQSTNDP